MERGIVMFFWPLELSVFACIEIRRQLETAHVIKILRETAHVIQIQSSDWDCCHCHVIINKSELEEGALLLGIIGTTESYSNENLVLNCHENVKIQLFFLLFLGLGTSLWDHPSSFVFAFFFCKCSALLGDSGWTDDARDPSVFLTAWHCAVSHERSVKWA